MPDKKISELTVQTGAGLADGDLFVTVDVDVTTMAASGTDKKITRSELVAGAWTRATFSNADHTTAVTTRYLGQTGTLSAARTVTLPAANAVPAGAAITIADESGSPTETNQVRVRAAGTDTIDKVAGSNANAGTTYAVIREPYGTFTFRSDGSSNWTTIARKPSVDVQKFTANGTWRKPFGVSRVRGLLIGGGGSGAGGNRAAASATGNGGGGGQAGGITGFEVPAADLSATETVTIASQVNGGAGKSGANGAGAAGSNGGTTSFSADTKWSAVGGQAGQVGANAATAGVGGTTLGQGTTVGAYGGDARADGTAGGNAGSAGAGSIYGAPWPCVAPGGGGGGGGVFWTGSANTLRGGGTGGSSSPGVSTNGAGLAGGIRGQSTDGNAGQAGSDCTSITANSEFGGPGGGGGCGSRSTAASTNGGAGGDGALYGGGGGGGGGRNGGADAGGNGGKGAAGVAVITSF
jgi:hypothetical protein